MSNFFIDFFSESFDNSMDTSNSVNSFIIQRNEYLKKDIVGYYHQYYTGFKKPDNPNFINTLKNTYNNKPTIELIDARDKVVNILMDELPLIIEETKLSDFKCVCVPRSKALATYDKKQLMFKEAVQIASNKIAGITDGTDCIVRYKNTLTTHLRNLPKEQNDGEKPYPGITVDTCRISKQKIINQNIILIDDIYTKTVNIDEDCIQALIDNGAKNIIFYTIGYTRRF